MKEQAIKKINTMGKIGHIISIITKIALIAGLVGIIIGGIALALLPDDFITAKFKGNANVNINLEDAKFGLIDFGTDFSDKEKEEIEKALLGEEVDIEIENMDFIISNANVDDSSINFDANTNEIIFKFHDLLGILAMAAVAVISTYVLIIFIDKLCIAIQNCASPFDETVIKKLENFAFVILGWSLANSLINSVITSILTHSVQIMVGIDFVTLALVLIILALSFVFKYGALLQQESDETL